MILDTSILKSKVVSSRKCDSFKKLHTSFIDRTVFASQSFIRLGRYHIETSPLIYSANQWTGFYMITASVMKELKKVFFTGFFFERYEEQFGNFVGHALFFLFIPRFSRYPCFMIGSFSNLPRWKFFLVFLLLRFYPSLIFLAYIFTHTFMQTTHTCICIYIYTSRRFYLKNQSLILKILIH